MHEARTDGADKCLALIATQGEYYQYMPPLIRSPDRLKPFFGAGVARIWGDGNRPMKCGFDGCNRNAMLAAFVPVSEIPLKAGDANGHHGYI
jgi:hypothetical protein